MPGPWELIIILVVVLLLFGGSRLAGLGKGVGRSIREFKEEVKTGDGQIEQRDEVVDAEIVQPEIRQRPADRPVDRPMDTQHERPTEQPQPERRPEV